MLRINKLADYGTLVMVYLAKNNSALSNARDIARATHLGIPTVSKLLKRLTTAGLLMSVRGAAGGYRLQRAADVISITEIIYALEMQRGLTECSQEPNACALQQVCHVQSNWQLISQAIEKALAGISLAMLATPSLLPLKIDLLSQLASGVNHD